MTELEVLALVSGRLDTAGLAFMVTGSMALAHYATPRMTRDIDIVVELSDAKLSLLGELLGNDFYFDEDYARHAVRQQRLFNVMHHESAIKVDFIVRKTDPYRQEEFRRRRKASLGGISTWIVSREDLILSKLVWARESKSELQHRDVRALVNAKLDVFYLRHWATTLGVESALEEYLHE